MNLNKKWRGYMEIKEELENYNDYKSDIKRIDRDIAKLKLEEVTISGSNFEVNGDIRPKRIYEL
jgi:hypothetical protein